MSGKIKDAFSEITADEQMTQDVKNNLKVKQTVQKTATKGSFYKHPVFRVAVACVAILCLVFVGFFQKQTQVEAAYVQMNGIVQIGMDIDKDNQVIRTTGLNAEGEQVLLEVDVVGKTYEEALGTIMSCNTYEKLEGESTEISVECKDEERQSSLESTGKEACDNYENHYQKQHGKNSSSGANHGNEDLENENTGSNGSGNSDAGNGNTQNGNSENCGTNGNGQSNGNYGGNGHKSHGE